MQATSLMPLFHVAGIAIGLLLCALIWFAPRGNRSANRWLAGYVALLAGLSMGDLLEDTRLVLDWPQLGHLTDWMIFLVGPCLWMYVRRLTLHATPSRMKWGWHALPAALCIGLLIPFYGLPSGEKRLVLSAELADGIEMNLPLAVAAAQMLAYWAASLLLLARFTRELRENFSSLERRTFTWLRHMLLITLAMWLLWLLGITLHWRWAPWLDTLAVPAGLYLLAFLGLRQPALFAGSVAFERVQEEPALRPVKLAPEKPAEAPARYARSGLNDEARSRLLARLQALMHTDKPWLENDLTLGQLAARIEASPHHLSQVLNQELGVSFFDFINARRVEEMQRCLRDPAYRSETIMALALASGFSSKAGFNAVFKQHAGMTPSAYRRQFDAVSRPTGSAGPA